VVLLAPGLGAAVPPLLLQPSADDVASSSRNGLAAALLAVAAVVVCGLQPAFAIFSTRNMLRHANAQPQVMRLIEAASNTAKDADPNERAAALREVVVSSDALWTPSESFLDHMKVPQQPSWRRTFLYPAGFWGWTVARADAPWLWMTKVAYGSLRFAPSLKQPTLHYGWLRYLQPPLVGFLIGLQVSSPTGCAVRGAFLASLQFLLSCYLVLAQPYRLALLNGLRATNLVCVALLALAKAFPENMKPVATPATYVSMVVSLAQT